MSTVAAPRLPATGARERIRARALTLPRPRPELAALLVVAGLLNLWALSRNGWANDYYSAAVRSMASSWHAFLYGSFDQAGVMTVDKPPLALWVQVGFVKAFGYHPLSMLVPQALMGIASVALVYDLVRRPSAAPPASSPDSSSRRRRSPSRSHGTTTPTRSSSCARSPRCGSSSARSRTGAPAG